MRCMKLEVRIYNMSDDVIKLFHITTSSLSSSFGNSPAFQNVLSLLEIDLLPYTSEPYSLHKSSLSDCHEEIYILQLMLLMCYIM